MNSLKLLAFHSLKVILQLKNVSDSSQHFEPERSPVLLSQRLQTSQSIYLMQRLQFKYPVHLVHGRKKRSVSGEFLDQKQMAELLFSTRLYHAILSIKILLLTANVSWQSKVMPTELLMLTMFFKGRSKSHWIYFVEIMVLAINMDDRYLIAVEID